MEHRMKLHDDKRLFRQAVQATAQRLRIPEVYVEKDYWVTFALHAIFHSDIGRETVFKGGTALSKCFGLIERFSEDIDLVVLRNEGESNNRLTNKIREIGRVVSGVLPEVQVANLTQKMGMNRKTAHTYAKEFTGAYGQVRDVIVVEATWLGHHEPHVTATVNAMVYQMMLETGQEAMAEEHGLRPFHIRALDPRRTICEKIMSLVRFSYTEDALEDLRKKVRHTYDLQRMLSRPELREFLGSDEFTAMLLRVARDDADSYRNNNDWLRHHPADAMLFAELPEVWDRLKATYTGDFGNLVFGELPSEASVYSTLEAVRDRLQAVSWPSDIVRNG